VLASVDLTEANKRATGTYFSREMQPITTCHTKIGNQRGRVKISYNIKTFFFQYKDINQVMFVISLTGFRIMQNGTIKLYT